MSERIKPLSKAQRDAIVARDDGQSQMRHYTEEKGWYTGGYCEDGGEGCNDLQVHHIKPRRTCETQEEADNPRNLITLYACEHNGKCKDRKIKRGDGKYTNEQHHTTVHSDMRDAIKNYKGNKRDDNSFQQTFKRRNEMIAKNKDVVYYDPDHDTEMTETAEERTVVGAIKGWFMPKRGK